jgi:signal transduction histidine kinase
VGAALCATAALIAASSGSDADGPAVVGRVVVVAVPFAVGAFSLARPQSRRFGWVLLMVAVAVFLTTLAESGDAGLYSVGRVAQWLVEVGLIYLVLSFPTGTLPSAIDRALVGAAIALVAVLYLPTVLVTDGFPLPTWSTSCEAGCPANAFQAFQPEPAAIEQLVRPLREILTMLLFAAATFRLAWRVRHATRLMRLTLTPVLIVAGARLVVFVIALGARRVDPSSAALGSAMWLLALAIPALAIGVLVGLVRWRLFVGEALQRLATRLHANLRPGELRHALADAFGDPSLTLAYASRNGAGPWIDGAGLPTAVAEDRGDRAVTYVVDDGRPLAAIGHDATLRDQPYFTEAAASYAVIALENERLASEVEASLHELRGSRSRIVASADRERQRIERDLHDGAQQHLVALRMRLELAEELIGSDPERGQERIHAIGQELGDALDEIRSLARGVYPPLLADQGLAEALRSAALQAPITTRISAAGVLRHGAEIESAVYFCCLEALQNACKHAVGATTVMIELTEAPGALRIDVRDNGDGFDAGSVPGGAGIANMIDRIAAVGGTLSVDSAVHGGTVVHGSVPVP